MPAYKQTGRKVQEAAHWKSLVCVLQVHVLVKKCFAFEELVTEATSPMTAMLLVPSCVLLVIPARDMSLMFEKLATVMLSGAFAAARGAR